MKRIGPNGESLYECGAMDLYEGIQMLAGQGRQNYVAVLDACIPAPSLVGMFLYMFLWNYCLS